MQALAIPAKRRALTEHDDSATIAEWVERTALILDPTLPPVAVGRAGQVAKALVDNALRHGVPPVIVEVSTSAFVTVEVTDASPQMPVSRADGTGSLAAIVDAFTSLWDVVENEGSKTVTALIPIDRPESPLPDRKSARDTSRDGSGPR
jgi:hypothetical protein